MAEKNETLGRRIARLRLEHGMTQERLARELGVTAQAVSKWENDLSAPDIMLLPELARTLGVTVDALLGAGEPVSGASEGAAAEAVAEPEPVSEEPPARAHARRGGGEDLELQGSELVRGGRGERPRYLGMAGNRARARARRVNEDEVELTKGVVEPPGVRGEAAHVARHARRLHAPRGER